MRAASRLGCRCVNSSPLTRVQASSTRLCKACRIDMHFLSVPMFARRLPGSGDHGETDSNGLQISWVVSRLFLTRPRHTRGHAMRVKPTKFVPWAKPRATIGHRSTFSPISSPSLLETKVALRIACQEARCSPLFPHDGAFRCTVLQITRLSNTISADTRTPVLSNLNSAIISTKPLQVNQPRCALAQTLSGKCFSPALVAI